MGKYDDIIDLPHHQSDYYARMPMENRAAQFAPFAALSGHEDAIDETARLTESLKELSETEINTISGLLKRAIDNKSRVRINYFRPDKSKSGGAYQWIEGKIKNRDEIQNIITMIDGSLIPIKYISEIVLTEEDVPS